MNLEHSQSLNELKELWSRLLSGGGLTLSKEQESPTSPINLIEEFTFVDQTQKTKVVKAVLDLLNEMNDQFPNNIFWDLDALIFSTLKSCFAVSNFADELIRRQSKMKELMILFGKDGPIRFEYFHDFTYGFDFLKWQKSKGFDKSDFNDPFSNKFLDFMIQRGREIKVEIAKGSQKYPKLGDSSGYRNRYPFPRDRESETKGMRRLKDCNLIPLDAWRKSAVPSIDLEILSKRNSLLAEK